MISLILSILISVASKVFGALLIIFKLFIKGLILIITSFIKLIKNLITKIKDKGGTKCEQKKKS